MLGSSSWLRPFSAALPVASTSRAVFVKPPPFVRSFASRQRSWSDEDDDDPATDRSKRDAGRWAPGTRWTAPKKASNKQRQRQQRKQDNPPPSEADLERYRQMRIQRAERLERRDLTAQMTETKTYMGGFTQPRHFQYLTVMDPTRKNKDSYEVRVGENRIRPEASAYEPHTVYLAVTRHPIRWGHGRATRREVFSGYCKESELAERFKELNYGRWVEEKTELVKLAHGKPKQPVTTPAHWACLDDSKEYLDLAVLPGSPEERALLNRPASHQIRALEAELKRLTKKDYELYDKLNPPATPSEPKPPGPPAKAPPRPPLPDDFVSPTADRQKEIKAQIRQIRTTLRPAVENYERPTPPYLDPRLVVPFLTVTLPTRPLAATVARLCNAHPRGLPFMAGIPNDDRRDGPALFRRLLRLRTNRLQELTQEIVQKITGHGGGLMAMRLKPEDRGRGIEGEGLSEEVKAPTARGWAEFSWLDEKSPCWEGIAKEQYIDGWAEMAEAKRGPDRAETTEWMEPHPLVEAAPTKQVVVPAVEMADDAFVEQEKQSVAA
ncbi:hypothetical protein JCM10213_002024 [Rhodosporidiobolus nylandii]